jgi:hypothetical protein
MPGLVEQRLQSIRIGGISSLGLLGFRHAELVKEHHLQLFWRAEIDLLTDHAVGGLGRIPDRLAELTLQRLELGHVDGDADSLHGGQRRLHRKLHFAEQRG